MFRENFFNSAEPKKMPEANESNQETELPSNEQKSELLLAEYTSKSGESVELRYKYATPQEGVERIPGKSVLFLSGWGDTQLNSAMGTLQDYADNAKADAYMIMPRAEGRSHRNTEQTDFLQEEADAIVQFVKEHNMSEVVIVGHSMGGDRALDVTAVLQNMPEIKMDGLILLAPVGLHERSPLELAKASMEYMSRFKNDMEKLKSEDAPFVYGLAQEGETQEDAATKVSDIGSKDVALSFTEEIERSKFGFPRRVMSEVNDMARKNLHAAEIHIPIVLIAGSNDAVAAYDTIMPKEEEQQIRKELGEEEGRRNKVLAARDQYLKETIFPNSPAVRMLVPDKMGNHLGHIFRPETFAKTSLYMLERINRAQEIDSEEVKEAA